MAILIDGKAIAARENVRLIPVIAMLMRNAADAAARSIGAEV